MTCDLVVNLSSQAGSRFLRKTSLTKPKIVLDLRLDENLDNIDVNTGREGDLKVKLLDWLFNTPRSTGSSFTRIVITTLDQLG